MPLLSNGRRRCADGRRRRAPASCRRRRRGARGRRALDISMAHPWRRRRRVAHLALDGRYRRRAAGRHVQRLRQAVKPEAHVVSMGSCVQRRTPTMFCSTGLVEELGVLGLARHELDAELRRARRVVAARPEVDEAISAVAAVTTRSRPFRRRRRSRRHRRALAIDDAAAEGERRRPQGLGQGARRGSSSAAERAGLHAVLDGIGGERRRSRVALDLCSGKRDRIVAIAPET